VLDGEIERGHLFLHASLSDQARHASEAEAAIYGLADLLVRRGLVSADELKQAIEEARTGLAAAGRATSFDIVVRENDPPGDGPPVDCETRLPFCKAVCCKLRFPLTVDEIEHGPLKWDLARPYFNRQNEHGYCHQIDGETLGCQIYDQRPAPCRIYSCADDKRIWKDFDAMIINSEWIEEHITPDRSPIEMFLNSSEH
jgi:Fe-S-cluster containining protein